MNDLDEKEPKYRCICGYFHVTKVAFLFGYVGVFLACVQLFVGYFPALKPFIFFNGCICVVVFFCLIIGEGNRLPLLYLPFLIVEGFKLVALWLLEFLLFVYWLWLLLDFVHPNVDVDADSDRAILIIFISDQNNGIAHAAIAAVAELGTLAVSFLLIATTIFLALFQWIYMVVWRAWQFRRCELTSQQLPTATTPRHKRVRYTGVRRQILSTSRAAHHSQLHAYYQPIDH